MGWPFPAREGGRYVCVAVGIEVGAFVAVGAEVEASVVAMGNGAGASAFAIGLGAGSVATGEDAAADTVGCGSTPRHSPFSPPQAATAISTAASRIAITTPHLFPTNHIFQLHSHSDWPINNSKPRRLEYSLARTDVTPIFVIGGGLAATKSPQIDQVHHCQSRVQLPRDQRWKMPFGTYNRSDTGGELNGDLG